jgi:hypothetical protein
MKRITIEQVKKMYPHFPIDRLGDDDFYTLRSAMDYGDIKWIERILSTATYDEPGLSGTL